MLLAVDLAYLRQQSPTPEAMGLEKRDAGHVVGEDERQDVGDGEIRTLGEGIGEEAPGDSLALVGGRDVDRGFDRPVIGRASIEGAETEPTRDVALVGDSHPYRP